MHTTSDKIEIMTGNETDEIVIKPFIDQFNWTEINFPPNKKD